MTGYLSRVGLVLALLVLAGCGSSAPSRTQLLFTAAQESNALGGGYDYACSFVGSEFIRCLGSGGGTAWAYRVSDGRLERVP